jgi:hypothetical protein
MFCPSVAVDSGEAWIVVHEVEGDLGSVDVDRNRYVVYQCVPIGCKPVSILKGTERTHVDIAPKRTSLGP